MLKSLPEQLLITANDLDYTNSVILSDFTLTQTQLLYSQTSKVFFPDNNFTSVNAQSRIGKFQFTAEQIEILGLIKLGATFGFNQQINANALVFNNTANWVGKYQCFSIADFLNSQSIQNKLIHEWFIYIDDWMKYNTVFYRAASLEDRAGYLLAAHLAGFDLTIKLHDYFAGNALIEDPKNTQGYNLSSYFLAGSRAVSLKIP